MGHSDETIFAQFEQQHKCPHGRKITSHYKNQKQ